VFHPLSGRAYLKHGIQNTSKPLAFASTAITAQVKDFVDVLRKIAKWLNS